MKEKIIYGLISFVLFLIAWEVIVVNFNVPDYIFPSLSATIKDLVENRELLWQNAKITFLEASTGLVIGVFLAAVFSLITVYNRIIGLLLFPLVLAMQAVPKIAIAPFLASLFGYGITTKIVVSAMVCFFPVVISMTKGLNGVEQEILDLAKSYRISKFQTLLRIQIPNSLPDFFVGIKIVAPLSLVGAVVGEFVGSSSGLGSLIIQKQAQFEITLVFASIILLMVMGIILFSSVLLAEKIMIPWKKLNVYNFNFGY